MNKPMTYPVLEATTTIGVVAFGSPLSDERCGLGVAELQRLGYQVRMPLSPSLYYGRLENGFANGSVDERLNAFESLLQDPEVKLILSARGGYGVLELFERIDWKLVQKANKPIVGLSDTTVLLLQGPSRLGIPMIHGPSLGDAFADAQTSSEARASVDSLQRLLHQRPWSFSAKLTPVRRDSATQKSGRGWLLAGNLTMLCAVLGTPWDISYDGAVLVVEDVGESPFKVHRHLMQLYLAGKFTALQGLVFGRFSKCSAPQGPSVDEVFEMFANSVLRSQNFPILKGLAVGHWGENQALPLGADVRLVDETFSVVL